MNLPTNLQDFMAEFRSMRHAGQEVGPWVTATFHNLIDVGHFKGMESLLRWSMLELVNSPHPEDRPGVSQLFPALVAALIDVYPRLTEASKNPLGGNFSMGLTLCSNPTRSALDALGGPEAVIPVLEKLPEGIRIPVQTYAAQDVLGITGTSSARTPGVVLIDEWIRHDPEVAKSVSVEGLLSRLGENPLPDDALQRHSRAVANVASAGLELWLTNQSHFKFRLHQAKASRQGIHVLSTGMVSLTRYHGWSIDGLRCLEGKRVARRLEKALGRAMAERFTAKSWYPQEEISALCAQVRRRALEAYVIPGATTVSRAPRM